MLHRRRKVLVVLHDLDDLFILPLHLLHKNAVVGVERRDSVIHCNQRIVKFSRRLRAVLRQLPVLLHLLFDLFDLFFHLCTRGCHACKLFLRGILLSCDLMEQLPLALLRLP